MYSGVWVLSAIQPCWSLCVGLLLRYCCCYLCAATQAATERRARRHTHATTVTGGAPPRAPRARYARYSNPSRGPPPGSGSERDQTPAGRCRGALSSFSALFLSELSRHDPLFGRLLFFPRHVLVRVVATACPSAVGRAVALLILLAVAVHGGRSLCELGAVLIQPAVDAFAYTVLRMQHGGWRRGAYRGAIISLHAAWGADAHRLALLVEPLVKGEHDAAMEEQECGQAPYHWQPAEKCLAVLRPHESSGWMTRRDGLRFGGGG